MKQKIYLLLLGFFYLSFYAQPPQGIGYQSVARNSSGIIVANTQISVQISILTDPGYVAVYRETHHPITNAEGLYSITIGSGLPDLGTFPSINWSFQNKHLKVEVDLNNGTTYPAALTSISQFRSAPYALYAKTTQATSGFSVRDNINALKAAAGLANNELVYLRGHSVAGDGGEGLFIWKTDAVFRVVGNDIGYFSDNNDGTIVRVWNEDHAENGRWVRLYDDYISVAYFGATGYWGDATLPIQRAIDFAARVAKGSPDYQSHFPNTTVFIPSGIYPIDKITLKDGVDIVGESLDRTSLVALPGSPSPCLIDMEAGMVHTNVSNLHLKGDYPGVNGSTKTAMYLSGVVGPYGAGGLTNSTFKNIVIEFFKGHSIHLNAGGAGNLPNETTVFENVRAFRFFGITPNVYTLFIDNDNHMYSFINCQFDGGGGGGSFYMASTGTNVYINGNGNSDYGNPFGISFINTTFQNGDYGVTIDNADNVNFDTCWFENLGTGVFVDGTNRPCRGINISNSRFANVGGYGAFSSYLDGNYKINSGYCVETKKSMVNVSNNLMVGQPPCNNCGFAYAYPDNLGLNLDMNSVTDDTLAKTTGAMQSTTQSGSTLDCKQNVALSASFTGTISILTSGINTGESVMIKAASSLVFSKTTGSNITFPGSANTLTLNSGQIAEFMKIDANGSEAFQLIRIKR